MNPSTLRFLGFIAGFIAALTLMFVLFVIAHDLLGWRSFVPRGIGWLVMPFLWGIWWASASPEWWHRLENGEDGLSTKFRTASKLTRGLIVSSAMWVFSVGLFVFMFDPYGSYTDLQHLLKVMSFPPMIGFAGLAAYKKLVAPEIKNPEVNLVSSTNSTAHKTNLTMASQSADTKHRAIPDDHDIISLPASSLDLQRNVEHVYLNRLYANFGGWTLGNQTTIEDEGRVLDRFEIFLGDGRVKTVWFDITQAWTKTAQKT